MNNHLISFLSELEKNNNREWFHSHDAQYREAKKEFECLVGDLILEIGKKDSSILANEPDKLTFKLMRDTRFSHDKSPYNPAFRCHISPAGKVPIPVGYYLSIQPGGRSFLGGGLFADMFKEATAMVRDAINEKGEEFERIIEDAEFKANFTVRGRGLKNVPKEYSADHPQAEFLKYKCWYIEYPIHDGMLDDEGAFVRFAADKFLLLKPFNDFLNRAMAGFSMPER